MSDFDTNGDGFVDAAEVGSEWGLTEDNAQHTIDMVDSDGDGRINTNELKMVLSIMEANYVQGMA